MWPHVNVTILTNPIDSRSEKKKHEVTRCKSYSEGTFAATAAGGDTKHRVSQP